LGRCLAQNPTGDQAYAGFRREPLLTDAAYYTLRLAVAARHLLSPWALNPIAPRWFASGVFFCLYLSNVRQRYVEIYIKISELIVRQ
jgi:hypothetical protein